MHSFLIVSKNRQNALDYAKGECIKNKIDKFDISILSFEKLVGIEDVRNVQKKLILKPLKSKEKAVILDGSNGLTIEAQNALLKVLEEPPANTIIYVTTPNKDLLLPTILSRCQTITLKESFELSKDETTSYLNVLMSLPEKSVGEKLKLAQDIAKSKDEIIPELEKMIIVARSILLPSFWGGMHQTVRPDSRISYRSSQRDSSLARMTDEKMVSQYLNILISLNKTHTILKTTNVNPRLALENLFLNI